MTTQGWGVWLVREGRWRRATCDAHPDAAVVYRYEADAVQEALEMQEDCDFGPCIALPFDWNKEPPNDRE